MIMPKSGGGGAEDAAAWRKAQDELDQWVAACSVG